MREHRTANSTLTATVTVAYVDGVCLDNPGPGGWGIVTDDGREWSGHLPATTNNRAEMTAAIEAVERIAGPVLIRSDSQYVVRGANEWARKWQRQGTLDSRPNSDLWRLLLAALCRRGDDVALQWVRGHAGEPLNERADVLANTAANAGVLTEAQSRP